MTWKDCFDPKNFKASIRSSLAVILTIGIIVFLWKASFAGEQSLSPVAELIVGYLAGVLTTIVAFYFGIEGGAKVPSYALLISAFITPLIFSFFFHS